MINRTVSGGGNSLGIKRKVQVDIIKGLSMLIIIVFHCSQGCLTGIVGEMMGRPWAVAVFFIIAGFFLKEEALLKPGGSL